MKFNPAINLPNLDAASRTELQQKLYDILRALEGGGGGADASESVKGVTKLSVAPLDPTNPIAVGDNDPRNSNARPPTGAAGGDLSGSYPNPSVVDDSHNHTAATLPATMPPSAHKTTHQVGGGDEIDVTGLSGLLADNQKSKVNPRTIGLGLTIDAGDNVIATGFKGAIVIPFAMTITGWSIMESSKVPTASTIVIDVWKCVAANYPPTVADTIAGTEKPTLSSELFNQNLTLTTWTVAVAAGDVIGFNVDSVSLAKRVTLVIQGIKTDV